MVNNYLNENPKIEIIVKLLKKNERIDKYITEQLINYSRNYIQSIIEKGYVKLNGVIIKDNKRKVCNEDKILISFPYEEKKLTLAPETFNFKILYEDDDLLVIDKPSGILVHPGAGNETNTVVNALLGKYNNFSSEFFSKVHDEEEYLRPGIVHRLDKETSGCLVIAKNFKTKEKMVELFKKRRITKEYFALVLGWPEKDFMEIKTNIGRHPVNRKKMSILENKGKRAVSHVYLKEKAYIKNYKVSLVKVRILTGRTHQIRLHLSFKNLPVIGDNMYGGKQSIKATRQLLHAGFIEFPHPHKDKTISISSQLPEDFKEQLNLFSCGK